MPSPLALLAAPVLLLALDAGLRRAGAYASTAMDWLPAWREVSSGRAKPPPYREGARRAWALVHRAGAPRATTIFLPPVVGVAVFWSLASVLALLDLGDVLRGTRTVGFVLASLSLCVLRGLAALAALFAAYGRRAGLFFKASAVALGLDAALTLVPLPCSDDRTDDIRMALAGGVAQAALALGFTISLWRRRGFIESTTSPDDGADLGAEQLGAVIADRHGEHPAE